MTEKTNRCQKRQINNPKRVVSLVRENIAGAIITDVNHALVNEFKACSTCAM